jgi:serine/threonine-protein kinase
MEYVDGAVTLETYCDASRMLAPRAAAQVVFHAARALEYSHNNGVIHRDVKPSNVLLAGDGRAKLTDFGIARVPDSTLTGAGNILGTPAYSAPEAIRSSKFSSQSDQFSLAATLYEAISGRRAFPGDDAVFVAAQIANEEPPRIAAVCNVASAVDTVLARAGLW